MNSLQEEEFVTFVKESFPQAWTITTMLGKWDYALFFGVKTIGEAHLLWDKLLWKYKQKVKQSNFSLYTPIYNFNRKFFPKSKEEPMVRVYGLGKEEKLDELDQKIIAVYAPDVRQSSLEMGTRLKVTSDTIRNRIKKLEKSKVIVGYKLGLSLEKLGYTSYRVDFQLNNTHRNLELLQYCKMHPYIYQLNKSLGGADLEIEVVAKDLNHLVRIIDEMKIRFADTILDAEWFGFSTFHVLKYIPD